MQLVLRPDRPITIRNYYTFRKLRMSRIRNRQETLNIWGQKWCSEGKYELQFFYAMNKFEIAHFSLFVIDA